MCSALYVRVASKYVSIIVEERNQFFVWAVINDKWEFMAEVQKNRQIVKFQCEKSKFQTISN